MTRADRYHQVINWLHLRVQRRYVEALASHFLSLCSRGFTCTRSPKLQSNPFASICQHTGYSTPHLQGSITTTTPPPLTCFCLFFLQNCHLYCSLGYAIRAQGNDLRHSRRRPALQRPPPWRVCRPIPDHDRRQALRDARHVRSFCVLRLDSYFCAEHPTRARAQHNTTRTTQHPADIQCVCGYILYIYINRPSSCVVCADRHVVWHVVCHHAANATPIPRRRI